MLTKTLLAKAVYKVRVTRDLDLELRCGACFCFMGLTHDGEIHSLWRAT